jgi:hypothetical protein
MNAQRVCGNCNFCRPYELLIYPKDMATLKASAQEILQATPGGPVLRVENVINVLILTEKFRDEKIHCTKEHCWTSFLEPACSLWQPRHVAGSSQ